MTEIRPEEHLGLVRVEASRLCKRIRTANYEDLVSVGNEALLEAAAKFAGDGRFSTFAVIVVRRRMVDAERRRLGRTFGRRPLEISLEDLVDRRDASPDEGRALGRQLCRDLSRVVDTDSSAEDVAMDSVCLDEALELLTPRQRLVAVAAMEPGGQRRLAAELGVTESALSHEREKIRRRLAPYFDREAA